MDKIGIIILAAGDSSRLGRPKQLLPFGGKTFLAHIVDEAVEANLEPVIVVTGAYAAEVGETLKERRITIVYNPHWEEGMASGIVAGLAELQSALPHSRGVIVAVCDQPYLSANLLGELVEQFRVSGKNLVACAYGGTLGTPVLFGSRYFGELSALSGPEGARKLLKLYPDDVTAIHFPKGSIDIDTEEDLKSLGRFPSGS
jgi:molybdenum cofactor cytidylyltransferase